MEGYCGQKDVMGLPHGRGTLILDIEEEEEEEEKEVEGEDDFVVVFQGHFRHGVRHGRGTLSFCDKVQKTEEYLEGVWIEDHLTGQGKYSFSDGSTLTANYVEGMASGFGSHIDARENAIYQGEYEDNDRHGKGTLFFPDGGSLSGLFHQGLLSDPSAIYSYPDKTTLKGEWEDGAMVSASFESSSSTDPSVFTFDESTHDCISLSPLQSDPYELQYVYVEKSTISNGGEGLFAKKDIAEGTVLSFYNGIRLLHKEVDERDWKFNDNTISLNDEIVIDVPLSLSSLEKYCATLGHKANHFMKEKGFLQNAKYDLYSHHPRFGEIKCIRSIKPIQKGEEIFVDYGYDHETLPHWYQRKGGKREEENVQQPPKKRRKK